MPRSRPEFAQRPGTVLVLHGIVLQNDAVSAIGRYVIRPFEALDRWIAGVRASAARPPLAMHAGLHVQLSDRREFVAEQLVGTPYMDLRNGLNWTPIERFRARNRGGWDLTVPATAFRGVDDSVALEVVERLNRIEGHPFLGEDCTAFIERAFGGRRLFADSPLLQVLGVGVRVGDPALALLRSDARLDERAERLLHADALRRLPDPTAHPESPNVRLWLRRLAVAAVAAWALRYVIGGARGR